MTMARFSSAIVSNGPGPVVNGKRTSAARAGLFSTPFTHLLMMNCVICCQPPRPWWQRKCFAVTAATAIVSNGSKPMVNDKRTSAERADPFSTPFAHLLTMNCVICHRASAPLPLAAAKALCTSRIQRYSSRSVKARG